MIFLFSITAIAMQVVYAQNIQFVYGPAHSPPALPVYAQIIILHVMAVVLALSFFFLRRYIVNRLNMKAVASPPRRYTARREYQSPSANAKCKMAPTTGIATSNNQNNANVGGKTSAANATSISTSGSAAAKKLSPKR